MAQSGQTSKVDLILDDLLSEIEFTTIFDPSSFFSTGSITSERVRVTIDNVYLQLYNEYPDKYKRIFSIFHNNINNLFFIMNRKMDYNRHFNAEPSRELFDIIERLDNLMFNLRNDGIEVTIVENYKNIIDECRKFLVCSGGSRIPDTFPKINVIK